MSSIKHLLMIFTLLYVAGCTLNSTAQSDGTTSDSEPENGSAEYAGPTEGMVDAVDCSEAPSTAQEHEGVTLTSDRFGNQRSACHFSGDGSFLRVDRDINPEAMPELTITLWARQTEELDSGRYQVISHDDSGFDRSMGLDHRGEQDFGWSAFAGSAEVIGGQEPTPGQWVMMTVTYDESTETATLYVDDRQVSQSNEATLGSGHDYIHIGANPDYGEHFPGDIDDIRIYDRALSDSEVRQLYEATSP